jgi:phosphoenolpyruvate-protein phosphotransferase (PTS system enzyme I)
MTQQASAALSVHGIAVSRGIAIGRAVCISANRARVAHYKISPEQVAAEVQRVAAARQSVVDELVRLQHELLHDNTT